MKRRTIVIAVTAVVAISVIGLAIVNARRRSEHETWQPSAISYGRIIELDTSAPGYWWIDLRTRVGHLPGGRRAAEQVVKWYPSSAAAHYNLGAFLYVFDSVRAKAEFERALQLDPAYSRAAKTLRDLQQDLSEGKVTTSR